MAEKSTRPASNLTVSNNPSSQNTSSLTTTTTSTSPIASTSSHCTSHVSQPMNSNSTDIILATALVNITAFDGKSHSFRALLDNASQESFVSRKVVQFMGIKPLPTSIIISGVGQSQAPKPLGQINFAFGSRIDSNFQMKINATVLPIITYTLPTKSLTVDTNLIAGLQLADPTYGTPGTIDILLSASVVAALTIPNLRKEATLSTIALQTKLGWVLFGEAKSNSSQPNRKCFHITPSDQISTLLQEFWKVEEVPTKQILSKEDEKCQQIYSDTTKRSSDGRYIVNLPFINEPPILGFSRDRAVSRFMQIERKLAINNELKSEYIKCMKEYIDLGHMHLATSTEEQHRIELPNGKFTYSSYYLPHHAVVKADSSTTKVRVVFDASCKTSNGSSLNEKMFIGPVIQDSLFNLLLRWRMHPIVIKADIEKMYRQILVTTSHQPYQRIVWRNDPKDELQDFELRTVTFGTASAPFLAIKTIQQIAIDEFSNFPLGAEALQHDFYVDDLLSGADTIEDAIELQKQITNILLKGGFPIRKWSSNHNMVTDHIEENAKDLQSNSDPSIRALGILWSPKLDIISIKVSLPATTVNSKRTLLSEISKLFDPLGWIAPAIIKMKILLQSLWLTGLSWDDPLPPSIATEWNQFRIQLPFIEKVHINRWIHTTKNTNFQLQGFCDASEKAYAAVIYVRVQDSKNNWSNHLLTAKTRVAPVKRISLPRLELCGAVLLAKLLGQVQNILKATTVDAWTDSEIVLAWLKGHPNKWKTFVANRVSEIHNILEAANWHHVSSKENPADCASRGVSPNELIEHPLWWNGPIWLKQHEHQWPKAKQPQSTQLECRTSFHSTSTISFNDTLDLILRNCRTLNKANRVIALAKRWRSKLSLKNTPLSVDEILFAQHLLVRYTQQTNFPNEFDTLSTNKFIPKTSKIGSLNPFIDDNNMLRVGGRLSNAEIPFETRHPLIIPKNSRFTEHLIDDSHRKTLHGGVTLMLAHLRNNYWIIDARNTIRHRIHKCNICFKYSNPNPHQIMGNLPKPRVNISHPFQHTGLDYAGPIHILPRRRPGRPTLIKGYICVFICLSTKAMHLELVGDLSSTSFLAALDRFISRRGQPSDIYSDNGTNFVGASKIIDDDMQKMIRQNPQLAAKEHTNRAIQWHFIPPASPHFGGLWEAGVKSTKYHLRRIIGNGTCTFEELSTLLCQIECCLNSRPLCPLTNDPNDFEILTPGHFLIGRPLLSRQQPTTLNISPNRLEYWQRIYQQTQHFWKKWQSEYLSRLQQRPKWIEKQHEIQINDLVLLKEENLPPSQWKLARIIDVHPGTDGIIRVATIRTPTNILKRPIVKLCKLPSQ